MTTIFEFGSRNCDDSKQNDVGMDQDQLTVAIAAARAGAAELMSRYDRRVVHEKAPNDLVTDADLAAQQAIRTTLAEAFPDYAFVGEEQGETEPPEPVRQGRPDAAPCWVVDPLDGTVNYVHRLPGFAVSIALYRAGKMRVGVIYDPIRDELFTGVDGEGSALNGERLGTSGCTELADALIACSFPTDVNRQSPELDRFINVLEKCRSIRRLGSCALNMCYVATGRLDAYWATNVSAWDSAAGTVIAREAGACLTGYDGSEFDDWQPKFCVTASSRLQQALIPLLT